MIFHLRVFEKRMLLEESSSSVEPNGMKELESSDLTSTLPANVFGAPLLPVRQGVVRVHQPGITHEPANHFEAKPDNTVHEFHL